MELQHNNIIQRKIENRQFAMMYSSFATGDSEDHKAETAVTDRSEIESLWREIEVNLSEANQVKHQNGYEPIESRKKIIGKFIVICKKGIRKLIKRFMGWYVFPIFDHQNIFNGKILNTVALQREVVYKLEKELIEAHKAINDLVAFNERSLKGMKRVCDENAEAIANAVSRLDKVESQMSIIQDLSVQIKELEQRVTLNENTNSQNQKDIVEMLYEVDEAEQQVKQLKDMLEKMQTKNQHRLDELSELCVQNTRMISDDDQKIEKLSAAQMNFSGKSEQQIKQLHEMLAQLEMEGSQQYNELSKLSQQQGKRMDAVDIEIKRIGIEQKRFEGIHMELSNVKECLHDLTSSPTEDDQFYHAFEERFRGEREAIYWRLQVYVPVLKEHLPMWNDATFIDIGSGRGEWLDILRDNGAVNYVGIDLNETQNQIAREHGHKVVAGNAIEYLQSVESESIDLISGFQVIEHLSMGNIMKLLKESHRILKKGGMILFETNNPHNLIVAANTFYLDPSHKRPLDSRLMVFLAEYCGFTQVRAIDSNAHPKSECMDLSIKPAVNEQLLERINDLSWVVFGPQDYALFGVKE